MAETLSTFELKFADKAPAFALPDAWGKVFSLSDCAGENGTLVVFVCNHCPYVIHLADPLGKMAKDLAEKGVKTVAINSNDLEKYPQDGPEPMKEFSRQYGWDFPYLVDESQEVAKAYGAACTPDFFLFDETGGLAYAGQFDNTRPKSGEPATGAELRKAVDAMLAGDSVEAGVPSSGCNIKWKPGNEPKWFA
ncbi:thioredoxin family protein [Luteolibacter algae]|uniref:Thioredoxin family protein n=1 Tax=Luteolibacter algae TaxID=454151 RepID=A0ABW5D6Z4_9BACT